MKGKNSNKGSHTSHFPPHTSSNGITLIALVITIIVMLILVTVSITMAINGGLFGYAKNAVDGTQLAIDQEQQLIENIINEWENGTIGGNTGGMPIITAGQKASVNSEYTSGGKTAVIPAKFTVSGKASESTIDGGLVIYLIDDKTDEEIAEIDWENDTTLQTKYDQFVWIPVENINEIYMCQSEGTDTDGSGTVEDDEYNTCKITVENGEAKCTTHNSNKMAGRLYAETYGETFDSTYKKQTYNANSGLREPAIVTGSSGTSYDGSSTYLNQLSSILGTTGYDSSANFLASLQKEYNEIVKSVYKNRGFYVGRYETSGMVNSNTNATVKVVAGTTTGVGSVTWYRMYAQQRKYAENKGLTVNSTMIQGAAYDQVMKFVNGYNGYSVTTNNGKGNHSGSVVATGATTEDQVKNIFDLEGNVYTWTTEAYDTDRRLYRGSDFGDGRSASCRFRNLPNNGLNNLGSLAQLYI